jgi:hypothetical protein
MAGSTGAGVQHRPTQNVGTKQSDASYARKGARVARNRPNLSHPSRWPLGLSLTPSGRPYFGRSGNGSGAKPCRGSRLCIASCVLRTDRTICSCDLCRMSLFSGCERRSGANKSDSGPSSHQENASSFHGRRTHESWPMRRTTAIVMPYWHTRVTKRTWRISLSRKKIRVPHAPHPPYRLRRSGNSTCSKRNCESLRSRKLGRLRRSCQSTSTHGEKWRFRRLWRLDMSVRTGLSLLHSEAFSA